MEKAQKLLKKKKKSEKKDKKDKVARKQARVGKKSSSSEASNGATITLKFRVGSAEAGPALCTFPGGLPGGMDKREFGMYKNTKARKTHQRLVLSKDTEDEDVNYSAANYGKLAAAKGLCYAVGLVQGAASSRTIDLLPVAAGAVFPMALGSDFAADAAPEGASAQDQAYMTKRKLLADNFGSRKRQRIINSNISNMVNLQGDNTSLSVLDYAIQDHQQETESAGAAKGATPTVLPPHDAATKTVAEVYPLEQMVDNGSYANLDAKLFITIAKKPSELTKLQEAGARFANVVLAGVPGLKALKDKADRQRVARVWAALQHMMSFHMMSRNRKAETLSKNTSIPEDFKEWLLSSFTTPEARDGAIKDDAHPSACSNKLLCYMCITLVTASGFHLSKKQLDTFARDLKMTKSSLLQYFREVGCKASLERVELKAPLQLPGLETRKVRGKR